MVGIDFINDSRTIIVKINEEIDHHTCEKIRDKIDLAIKFRGARRLIFDFDGVNFMDSSGLGLIMGRYKAISKKGGLVGVVKLKPTVRKIFQMSGIFRILDEYENTEVAMQKMKVRV